MPPIYEQKAIKTGYAEAMGLPAGRCIVELLGQVYWCRSMAKDCEWMCPDHDVAQLEQVRLVVPPFSRKQDLFLRGALTVSYCQMNDQTGQE